MTELTRAEIQAARDGVREIMRRWEEAQRDGWDIWVEKAREDANAALDALGGLVLVFVLYTVVDAAIYLAEYEAADGIQAGRED